MSRSPSVYEMGGPRSGPPWRWGRESQAKLGLMCAGVSECLGLGVVADVESETWP